MDRDDGAQAMEDLAVSFGISTARRMVQSLRKIRYLVIQASAMLIEEPQGNSESRRRLRAVIEALNDDDLRLLGMYEPPDDIHS